MTRGRLALIAVLAVLVLVGGVRAQDAEPPAFNPNHPWQVFTRTDLNDPGAQTLIFLNLSTGELVSLPTTGARFTLTADSVVYWDTRLNRVRIATPDGTIRDHPFIQPQDGAFRVDWVFARGGKSVAWTQTTRASDGSLTTVTRTAEADGSNARVVLTDGPRSDGLRAFPVALSPDETALFMDYQPDGIADLTAFQQYAGLFRVALDSGETAFLSGEPGDFTGAGFGAGYFLRLALTDDNTGFDLRVLNLDSGLERVVPAQRQRGYTQAGDILISPDGRYAVYTLAEITAFGSPRQTVNTQFMLVDLLNLTQETLTPPITTFVRPVMWTEDNSAVIFVSPQIDGTWKVSLAGGGLEKIAEPSLLGIIKPYSGG